MSDESSIDPRTVEGQKLMLIGKLSAKGITISEGRRGELSIADLKQIYGIVLGAQSS